MPYSVIKSGDKFKIKSGSKTYKTAFKSEASAKARIKAMENFSKLRGHKSTTKGEERKTARKAYEPKSKAKAKAKNGRHKNKGRPKGSKNKKKVEEVKVEVESK